MRVVFIGTGSIGLPAMRMLRKDHELLAVVTQPDKPAGRKQQLKPSPVKAALTNAGVPVLQPARIKSEEAVAAISELGADAIVVIAYGQILPKAVLQIPKLACLNVHASLLPRWRGAAPVQAAIVAGDRATGITVMYMDEGLDTGDILLQCKTDIGPDETGGSLHDRLAQLAPAVLGEALALLEKGPAPRLRQDHYLATYAPKLGREEGRIDWQEPAEMIERKIRAFDPWPGAFTPVRGPLDGSKLRLKIFRAAIVPKKTAGFVFSAADAGIAPLEVQLEGRKRVSAEEFVRGHPGLVSLLQAR